jgi:hypothetical protein
VPRTHLVGVIKIHRVRHGAVGERCERRRRTSAEKYLRIAARPPRIDHASHRTHAFVVPCADGAAHHVDQRHPRRRLYLGRQLARQRTGGISGNLLTARRSDFGTSVHYSILV